MELPKISQSLMKTFFKYYFNKEVCGLFFEAQYLKKDPEAQSPPSDAMKAGIYFEYLCTGGLPRNGEIPKPDVSYKGKSNESLAKSYDRATQSSIIFKDIMRHYGIRIKKVGLSLSTKRMTGIIDIHALWDNKDVFIDLKYSGLIDDKWSEMGWDIESLNEKKDLMIQGVHYKLLAEEALGINDIPFYYFVFSSQNPHNVKIIRQVVDESTTASHIVMVSNTIYQIKKELKKGFKAYPSMLRCSKCPIAHKCSSKINYPIIEEVFC